MKMCESLSPRPSHPKGTLHGWLGRGSGPASGTFESDSEGAIGFEGPPPG